MVRSPSLHPARPTRQQRQASTKAQLLESAHAQIVQGGIMAISIRGVCEAAGYSQGAFYSNFASKNDLLLEIMDSHIQQEVDVLRALVAAAAQGDLDATLRDVAQRLAELSQTTQWSLLAIELQLHAQRDAQFAARYDACKAAYHTEFALLLDQIVHRHGLRPALPPLQAAIGLHALWSGFAVQGTVAGALPRADMLLAFFRALTGAPAADQRR